MRSVSSADSDGVTIVLLMVDTITAPIWEGSMPGALDRLA